MKILKYGLFGLLLGETIVLLQKDKKLKTKLKNKKAYEKIELVTKELVSVNKQSITTIQKSDMQTAMNNILEFFEIQEDQVQKIVGDIQERSKNLDQDHIHKFINAFKVQKK